jgi:hypothetical protein
MLRVAEPSVLGLISLPDKDIPALADLTIQIGELTHGSITSIAFYSSQNGRLDLLGAKWSLTVLLSSTFVAVKCHETYQRR